jgi:superfamily II DNA helicase RecQ
MDQQVESLRGIGIPSVALTAEQMTEPTIIPEISSGHYKMVFASPELTLAKEGHLWGLSPKALILFSS